VHLTRIVDAVARALVAWRAGRAAGAAQGVDQHRVAARPRRRAATRDHPPQAVDVVDTAEVARPLADADDPPPDDPCRCST
jgi:hypothetical protein